MLAVLRTFSAVHWPVGMVLPLLMGCFQLSAQDKTALSTGIKLGYQSTLIYPGYRTGLERPFRVVEHTKNLRSGSVRHFTKTHYWLAETGYYHHRNFHDHFFLAGGWLYRRANSRRVFTEFSALLGYSRTFLGATTYIVEAATRQVRVRPKAGYHYAILSPGFGVGRQLQRGWSVYWRGGFFLMHPSNNSVYLRPVLDAGVIYQPAVFWVAHPKLIRKVTFKTKRRHEK